MSWIGAGTQNMNLKPEYSLSSLAAVLMVSVDVKQDLKKKKTVRAVSAETRGLLGTGALEGHLDFHTAPDLCLDMMMMMMM